LRKPETWPKRPGAGFDFAVGPVRLRYTFEIRPTAWKAAEGRAWDTDGTILSAMQLSRLVREAEVGRVGETSAQVRRELDRSLPG
jgi:hypothetical protein